MKIRLYDNGSYTIDWGYKAASFPPPYKPSRRITSDGTETYFLWETDKGKLVAPKDMATPHIINALNMLWRNLFELKEDRPEIRNDWSSGYINRATQELSDELQRRVGLECLGY